VQHVHFVTRQNFPHMKFIIQHDALLQMNAHVPQKAPSWGISTPLSIRRIWNKGNNHQY